jgi:hypothetical protein
MSLFSHGKSGGGELPPYHPRPERKLPQPLTAEGFAEAFGGSADLVRRDLLIGPRGEGRAALFFVDGAVSGVWVTETVARPLTEHPLRAGCRDTAALFDRIAGGGVYNVSCRARDTMDDAVGDAIRGSAVLLLPGVEKALCFEAKGFPDRGVSEPSDETVIKGAKDGFVENVRFNTALVRRRVRTPDLRIFETAVGRQTQTTVSLIHIEGLTDPALVAELRRRVGGIDVDAVLMAQDIEEHLADEKTALFPLTLNTERCDRFCAGLVNGQIGLLVDGLPFGYLMPVTFSQLMKSPEDFARQSAAASFVTLLRYAATLITLLLPAFYLAVVTFHKEMIPTGLAEAIISAKKGVPFSSLAEVLAMLIAFEVLLEAGLRLPKPIGQAVSIVGGLVVGQAAVEANLLSPAVVIVVALAGVCGFTAPNQDAALAIRVTRLALVPCAAAAGLIGISLAFAGVIYRMAMLESFGVPYLAPFGTGSLREALARSLIRPFLDTLKTRSGLFKPRNVRNQK